MEIKRNTIHVIPNLIHFFVFEFKVEINIPIVKNNFKKIDNKTEIL